MAEPKKVLVVDDDKDFAFTIRRVLEKDGFAVETAHDGVECLERVRTSVPDAIVLDVMMPRKDGYETCKELKADARLADVPVLLLTAVGEYVSTTTYSHADGMTTEADDYIDKPVEPAALLKAVRKLVGLPA